MTSGCSTGILRNKLQEDVTLCNVQKCVAALRQSLRKVEPDSTSCSSSFNKNVALLYD